MAEEIGLKEQLNKGIISPLEAKANKEQSKKDKETLNMYISINNEKGSFQSNGKKRQTIEQRQHRESIDSGLSETSAMIQMTQSIKQKILRNHLMVILLLNLIQILALLFSIIWPPWYEDSDVDYGLLLFREQGSIIMNGFSDENNKEVGGISSFILFTLGILIQIIYMFQLLSFFKSYPDNKNRGYKILKFKTCRWLCLFLYTGAVSYWAIVVFLVQVVSDLENVRSLCYGFWIGIGCIIGFVIISFYFNFLKKKIRKNDLVCNLLNANRYLYQEERI